MPVNFGRKRIAQISGMDIPNFTTFCGFVEFWDNLSNNDQKTAALLFTKKQLRLKELSQGWTVAHELARRGYLSEKHMTPDIFSLKDRYGTLVVHTLVSGSDTLYAPVMSPDILSMRKNNEEKETTVAHIIAQNIPIDRLPPLFFTPEIIGLKDHNGWTPAHTLAMRNRFPGYLITDDLLSISNTHGYTVFATLLDNGHFPPEQLTPERADQIVSGNDAPTETALMRFWNRIHYIYQDIDPGYISRSEMLELLPEPVLRKLRNSLACLKGERNRENLRIMDEILLRRDKEQAIESISSGDCDINNDGDEPEGLYSEPSGRLGY